MALGPATVDEYIGHDNRAMYADLIHFAGEALYVTGGTPGFDAFASRAINRGTIDVVAVVPQDCGGYVPVYDKVNDKLKVFQAGAAGALVQVPAATVLSAVTFNVLVLSS